MLSKFLTNDQGDLTNEGAVYDESGSDGLDPEVKIEPEGEKRNEQRAFSAAVLWTK